MPNPTAEHRRWLQAIENAHFGVWDLDPRQETVHYAPAWKARLGFPRLHAADSTSFWRCRVHPGDVERMLGSLRSHLDGHADSYSACFRLRSNGSGYRAMVSRGRVIERDAHGAATRMVGTMIDLSSRPVVAARQGLASEDPQELLLMAPGRALLPALMAEHIADLLDIALRDAK